MSGAVIDPRLTPTRAAPRRRMTLSWSDPSFRNIVWQVLIIGIVVAIGWYLVSNTQRNLAERHIATGFDFLERPAPIPIGETLLSYTPSVSTYGHALLIGLLNTLKVAVVGVILATLLGTVIGVARLSPNWLIAKLAAVYVEVIRDIPVLLQLFFWYSLLRNLPPLQSALTPIPGVFLSNRGAQIPWLDGDASYPWCALAFAVGAVGAWLLGKWATKRQEATGLRPVTWPLTLALLLLPPLAVWLAAGAPFHLEIPQRSRFNFTGGAAITPEYFALTLGLVIYTAAYIAEIVRSGIQAVAIGQWEAAAALGLYRTQVLRQIVLPQALRVIIPPMTSQYLNLTKNSSLAVAIGFQDLVSIASTTLNQTGQPIEGIALIMAAYLIISLSISFFMNWYNARIALVGR